MVVVKLLPRPRVFAWLSLAALRLVGLVRAERPGKIGFCDRSGCGQRAWYEVVEVGLELWRVATE
jgi:hypothetical protein